MKLSHLKSFLKKNAAIQFELPDGSMVPAHFHVTEIGIITRHFIDCGGTVRTEKTANFQLWLADDFDHRLQPEKLLGIIRQSEKVIGLEDVDIEVEYQGKTIEKYRLAKRADKLLLRPTFTDCLAKDACGIPPQKQKVSLAQLGKQTQSCEPGSGCC
ncbi:MAG: DUF6428 family protein [Bacteroidota bacterium]